MKIKLFALVMFMSVLSTFCVGQQIRVESTRDEEFDVSEVKTFAWSSQVDDTLDAGLYFLNDLVLKSTVRKAIEGELMGLGYEKSGVPADMIVNFRVFDKPTTIKGVEGLGSGYWGTTNVTYGDDRLRDYEVEAGTLLIHFVDAETGKVFWQGFASGLIDGDAFVKDEVKIREAANLILEEFDERATDYTRK